ncbi:diguanylate cyclase (plasmid) [Brucella anthropi ATCC 49188]|uniref:diguanylate cyclase n=1 Tax=Brucella anthropi (strain ATCC 49188 / DSM 6882 / CCUG 24695 / JCM 21032 / LMG 3331 / NBRC 15819 / NCTC 12168 / Alc 37) TaxID=439375 RepID=A6X7T2_BRUA4|nr:diguanylate cyclase [Brucella anthropi ATCC 49188]SUB55810.1 Stalked cell differentiation-controlling protein [Brucella anthropi]
MLSCSWLLLSIAGVIGAFPVLSQMYEFQPSLRFGIALMSLGPLLVATINAARQKELSDLSRAAYFDVLTGLLSRSAFRERGQKLLRESIVAGRDLTAMMLDIDHFKQINDQNGHASGDKVLIDFAQLVRDQLREGDLFGRLGGEEFAILLPNTSSRQAEKIASRVRLRVQNATFTGTDNQPLKVTVSMGLVDIADCPSTKLDELLHCADQSMYAAKSSGRNIVIRHKSNAE